jgi:hypothetical protein
MASHCLQHLSQLAPLESHYIHQRPNLPWLQSSRWLDWRLGKHAH